MARQNEPLEATLDELRKAGFVPVEMHKRGGHWKIKCNGLPPITCSATAGDINAANQARRTTRRILAQNLR
jgi:hypothetical protein